MTDYDAIANDAERLKRTASNSIRTISSLYADRAHFIFELLQNAEDALRRRPAGWQGSRIVKFTLSENCLRVSHFGEPFDIDDVIGICSVGETTKALTDIGHFGIGFKSVYAFTDRPEIHSGTEDFAIEDFVRPVSVSPMTRSDGETVILIPRKQSDAVFGSDIASGLQNLAPGTLLFLREIQRIEWEEEKGPSGSLFRERDTDLGKGVRRVTVIGQAGGQPRVEETRLVFSELVSTAKGESVGKIEVAFSLAKEGEAQREEVRRVSSSPLVAFFPTALETNLGFLVQGPYRTTPSRENVPPGDPWNKELLRKTAELLVRALEWLRDDEKLDVNALECLPLDVEKFGSKSMFAGLFEATKAAIKSTPFLPKSTGGYSCSGTARLASTLELRNLVDSKQLGVLFGEKTDLAWLSRDITADRTALLRSYLMTQHDVTEVTPDMFVRKLEKKFLEAQPDAWVLKLYEFLGHQVFLRSQYEDSPLVRLADGKHVSALLQGKAQAFLPGPDETGFPTVRAAVCATDASRKFLESLGLTLPDPVDDVIRNLLQKYRQTKGEVSVPEYEQDMRRILAAFATDSKAQRDKLLKALRETAFVPTVDAGSGARGLALPQHVYIRTERLTELFAGVGGVLMVDDLHECLSRAEARDLLEASGVARYLRTTRPVVIDGTKLMLIRQKAGTTKTRSEERFDDYDLAGLGQLLKSLPSLDAAGRRKRASTLWDALSDLAGRQPGAFVGSYRGSFHGVTRAEEFDPAFVEELNAADWVPNEAGVLLQPGRILFEKLGWKDDPYLKSRIRFKSPNIDALAEKAGFEPGLLDWLKAQGLTSEAELKKRFGIKGAIDLLLPGVPGPTKPTEEVDGPGTPTSKGHDGGPDGPGVPGTREFVSYIAVSSDEEKDPDGLSHDARMSLEAKAIELIIGHEPLLQKTATNNPGFDLYETGTSGNTTRWVEVKAMTRSLQNRPVTMSDTQFRCAQEHREAYWLYIVEQAGTDSARIVRIQNPAGKAQNFTFDRGWIHVADVTTQELHEEA
ncbi:MAG: DUF3883 domain-containing protein [candidate division WOR-3 bacterium]|nr:DUF3883 domain-containing protein [candidate division WOR-3 bacterium]